jgi:hypothetical protein
MLQIRLLYSSKYTLDLQQNFGLFVNIKSIKFVGTPNQFVDKGINAGTIFVRPY